MAFYRLFSLLVCTVAVISAISGFCTMLGYPTSTATRYATSNTISVVVVVVNAAILPVLAYLAYFINWGRSVIQFRRAVLCLWINSAPVLACLLWIVRVSLRGGHIDGQGLSGTLTLLTVQVFLVAGVLTRREIILPLRPAETYPKCQTCGYNLTGNVSGRCPECGSEIRP